MAVTSIREHLQTRKGFPFAFERHQKPCTEKQVEHDCLFKYCSITQAEEITSSLWYTLMRRVLEINILPTNLLEEHWWLENAKLASYKFPQLPPMQFKIFLEKEQPFFKIDF